MRTTALARFSPEASAEPTDMLAEPLCPGTACDEHRLGRRVCNTNNEPELTVAATVNGVQING